MPRLHDVRNGREAQKGERGGIKKREIGGKDKKEGKERGRETQRRETEGRENRKGRKERRETRKGAK